MSTYTSKKGIVYKNQYHIIFCTKYRRKVLKDGIDNRLKELINEIVKEYDAELKALEVMEDHVHLFVNIDPRQAIHLFIKKIKGKTARTLRDEYPSLKTRLPCLWTNSYFLCTVGNVSEKTVKEYIEEQKYH